MQGPRAPPRRPQHQGDTGEGGVGGEGGEGGAGALEYWVGLGVGVSSSEDEWSARSCDADLFEVAVGGRFFFVLGIGTQPFVGSAVVGFSVYRCELVN